jgi:phosphopantothenoylcysteine synthetase/decarboxylase
LFEVKETFTQGELMSSHKLTAIINNTGTVLAQMSDEDIVAFFKAFTSDYGEEMQEALDDKAFGKAFGDDKEEEDDEDDEDEVWDEDEGN